MVRWALVFIVAAVGCRQNKPMADQADMPTMDTMAVVDPAKRDSMLDTMPGGEMVRGNDSAEMRLMKKKMP